MILAKNETAGHKQYYIYDQTLPCSHVF